MCRVVVEEVEASVGVQQESQRVALVQVAVHADGNWLTCEVNAPAATIKHISILQPKMTCGQHQIHSIKRIE